MKKMVWFVTLFLFVGCGEEQQPKVEGKRVDNTSPEGTWLMYGGSDTGVRTADDLDEEITVLVLGDSTYSLTLMEPHIHRNFVEKGQVMYDARNAQLKFTVHSATGVDFSGGEPRKLVDVEQIVPWQRDPGTEYVMTWRLEQQSDESGEQVRDVMVLSADDHEDSFFVRLEDRDMSQGPILDAQMKLETK